MFLGFYNRQNSILHSLELNNKGAGVVTTPANREIHLQALAAVHLIPPRSIVLEPLGKPCHDGVVPLDALVIIGDVVVLAPNKHQGGFAPEQLERGVHLNAFAHRHIIVAGAMHK